MQKSLLSEEVDVLGAKKEQDAILEIVRLTGDEVEFRPVVLVGELSEVDGKQVTSAVGARQSGVYNSFQGHLSDGGPRVCGKISSIIANGSCHYDLKPNISWTLPDLRRL